MNRLFKYIVLIFFFIIFDQITKGAIQAKFSLHESIPIIDGFFNFTYIRNTGAAFGLGAGSSDPVRITFFLALPVVACLWICSLIWKARKGHWSLVLAYSLVLSGAIGNLIDRFSLGYVVDFLDFYIGRSHFPAFNVADSAISVGGFLIFIDIIKESRKEKAKKTQGA